MKMDDFSSAELKMMEERWFSSVFAPPASESGACGAFKSFSSKLVKTAKNETAAFDNSPYLTRV